MEDVKDLKMEEELVTGDVIDNAEVYYMEPEEKGSGSGILGKLIVGGVIAVGGLTALALKNKDKIKAKRNEKKAKQLEAEGWVCTKIDDDWNDDDWNDDYCEIIDDESEEESEEQASNEKEKTEEKTKKKK